MRGVSSKGLKAPWVRAGFGLVFAAACAVAVAAGARRPADPDVVSVRLGGDAATTRVVIDLHKPASGDLDPADARPGQLALLLKGATTPGLIKGAGTGLVKGWSVTDSPGGARLTLDLNRKADVSRRFLLPPADGIANYRYVVDIVARPGDAPAMGKAALRGYAAADAAPAPQPPHEGLSRSAPAAPAFEHQTAESRTSTLLRVALE